MTDRKPTAEPADCPCCNGEQVSGLCRTCAPSPSPVPVPDLAAEFRAAPSTVECGDKPASISPAPDLAEIERRLTNLVDVAGDEGFLSNVYPANPKIRAAREAVLSSLRSALDAATIEGEKRIDAMERRARAAESSLARLLERVAGLAEGWERAAVSAKSLSDAAFARACEGNLSSNVSCAMHEARAGTLTDCSTALRSLDPSPSTPETKDDR